jgi:alkaline phosphatase
VPSLAELAQRAGWAIGYVTTSRVTHATPAAFYAHHRDRYDECAIARQLLEQGPDLVLGGGIEWFDPAARCREDLLGRARAAGYTVWLRAADLDEPAPAKLLGLLAHGHLPFQLDERDRPAAERSPSLRRLTEIALASLGRDGRSFFLLVEGARIDHAAHDFDAAGVAAEISALDDAVGAVLAFQRRRPDTLVVLTADHATGGLAINEFVDWASLERQRMSVQAMTRMLCAGNGAEAQAAVRAASGFPDLALDAAAICASAQDAVKVLAVGRAIAERNGITWVPRVDLSRGATHGHTGEDVPLYAGGPGAARFAGVLDNTDVARRIADLLDWDGLGAAEKAP